MKYSIFFELFDDYFRSDDEPRVLNDIYIAYPYILSRSSGCKENTMVRNVLTSQKHSISEFKDISSASVWGYPSRFYSNVKMSENLFKKMIRYHEIRKDYIVLEENCPIQREYQLRRVILCSAAKECDIFNQSMDIQGQGIDALSNKYYLTESTYLLYFNHLDIVEGLLRNYQ